ncbi:hypothetical protein C8Q74DRAFT_1215609 [Fomes fomentarius]|nr:hypothetical protein C8Q74DRAFT_1215609 [Fomes fomentarius]
MTTNLAVGTMCGFAAADNISAECKLPMNTVTPKDPHGTIRSSWEVKPTPGAHAIHHVAGERFGDYPMRAKDGEVSGAAISAQLVRKSSRASIGAIFGVEKAKVVANGKQLACEDQGRSDGAGRTHERVLEGYTQLRRNSKVAPIFATMVSVARMRSARLLRAKSLTVSEQPADQTNDKNLRATWLILN